MDESPELLPTSESLTEKPLSSEKSLRKSVRKNTKHNWVELKVEYLAGNIIDVKEFGRLKGISENTLEKATVGWRQEYGERQEKIANKALASATNRQANALASRLRVGRLFVARSMREFSKRPLEQVGTKQLAEIAKIGSEIQASVKESTPTNTVNVQVNNGGTIGIDPDVADALKAWARERATARGVS